MTLRVLQVIHTLDPTAGGVAAVCTRLAREQLRRGLDVRVLARHLPETADAPLPPDRVTLSSSGQTRDAVRWADYVHLHGVWDWVLFRAAREARRAGKPHLVAPHGMLYPWSLGRKRWKKRLALALGFRHMLNRATALHVLNPDEARAIEPLRLHSPVVTVPNGISLEEVDPLPPAAEFRRTVPDLGESPYVLFLSRLHPGKGLDYLADAFPTIARQRPDVHLVVAGPDAGARADFVRRIGDARLGGRVHLVGPLFGRAKWAAYAGARCFCLPSQHETFSVAILEALACRVPVVISDACHFPEIRQAGAGEVVPRDAAALARALGRVLGDPDARARMGAAGRDLVERCFTWDRVVDRLQDVYQEARPLRTEAVRQASSGE
jgi:glycosyltransferase involved in cell wall biosynthesis